MLDQSYEEDLARLIRKVRKVSYSATLLTVMRALREAGHEKAADFVCDNLESLTAYAQAFEEEERS